VVQSLLRHHHGNDSDAPAARLAQSTPAARVGTEAARVAATDDRGGPRRHAPGRSASGSRAPERAASRRCAPASGSGRRPS
jgi:hypothetical protein